MHGYRSGDAKNVTLVVNNALINIKNPNQKMSC